MKCSVCREIGHNRTTCPKNTARTRIIDLPRATPDELMRMLIDPIHALDLVAEGKAAEALANATRRIGELQRDDLGHLVCSDILIALAELDLRARQLPPDMIESLHSTQDAIAAAEAALESARHAHVRAKAEVLVKIGYREKAEALGFNVGIIETAVSNG